MLHGKGGKESGVRTAKNDSLASNSGVVVDGLAVGRSQALAPPTDGDFYRKLVDEQEVTVVRFCSDPETVARLFRINPALFSLLFGIGTHAFLDQFLKLWPQMRIQALPYLSVPAIGMGMFGWGIGAHSVIYPQDDIQSSRFKRTSVAMLEGTAAVFPGILGEEIEVYCSDPMHNCQDVSDAVFWGNFFPSPAVLSVAFIAWNMISPTQKITWASQSKVKKVLVISLDSVASLLLYSRIVQALLMNISTIPQPLIYEYAAIPAALIALGGQTLKPQHRQKLYTSIIYAMGANLVAYLVQFLMQEFSRKPSEQEQEPYSWSAILKLIAFPLLFLTGFAFTVMRSRQYVTERQSKERFVRVGSPRSLLQQQLDEALERQEVREQLVTKMLQDPRIKQEMMSDRIIVSILMRDPEVVQRLMAQAGFVDVDLQGSETVSRVRTASVSMHLVDGGEEKGRNLSVSLSDSHRVESSDVRRNSGSSIPPPILTAYQQHLTSTQPSRISETVVPDDYHQSSQNSETQVLLAPDKPAKKKSICVLM